MSKLKTVPVAAIGITIQNLLRNKAWKATKFISDYLMVRATRQLFRKKLSNIGNLEIILTVGKPNYEEREYVALCKKAGEKLLLKRVWLKYPPKLLKKRKK